MADDGKFFDLEIITPDRVFWTGKASMLELNTTEGEVGIYKRHIPMTMIIEPGIVKIHEEDGIREAAVHAGFIEILPDRRWLNGRTRLTETVQRKQNSALSAACRHMIHRSISPGLSWL